MLPKWPQMLVWGKPVTVDQAKDIIFKKDMFVRGVMRNSDLKQ